MMLEARELTVSYEHRIAVESLSLSLNTGEITAVGATYVMVRFGTSATGVACRPSKLELEPLPNESRRGRPPKRASA